MGSDPWNSAFAAGRDLGLAALENALYVRKEIPGLGLAEELQHRLEEACETLVGVKHDVSSELWSVAEVLEDPARGPVPAAERLSRLVRATLDELEPVHDAVLALRGSTGPGVSAACVLLEESAANVFAAFVKFRVVVASLETAAAPSAGS